MMRAWIASWSRVKEMTSGSKPASRQTRTISPSAPEAIQAGIAQVGQAHRGPLGQDALFERDLRVGMRAPQVRDGGGDEAGKCRRKRADAQPRALAARSGCQLRVGEREAFGDGIRVLEQDLPGAREAQAARFAIEQPCADLALEQRDLVGDRWL